MNEIKIKENHKGKRSSGNAGICQKDKDCFSQPLLISGNEHVLFETRFSLEEPQN